MDGYGGGSGIVDAFVISYSNSVGSVTVIFYSRSVEFSLNQGLVWAQLFIPNEQ